MKVKPIVTKRQREERARRKAMGVALIERPLRVIAARTNTMAPNGRGGFETIASFQFKQSRIAADRGNGREVARIARNVLRA